MEALKEYLLSVTAAAVACALVLRLHAGKGSAESMIKILTGILMALTVLGPVAQIRLPAFSSLPDTLQAQTAVLDGEETARAALAESISTRVEAYILENAADLGLQITVDVELSRDPIPIPVRIYLQGNISPYAKQKLQTVIREDLGIDKENQIWT